MGDGHDVSLAAGPIPEPSRRLVEKAQRDYQWGLNSAREQGRQEGWEEGREEGRQEGELLGKIRILQELLGDEPSTPENLDERTIGELSEILADLQQRLRSRDS